MKERTPESIRQFIVGKHTAALRDAGLDPNTLPDNFDLFDAGILDSLGILTMITDVEDEFGVDIDMEPVDPEELTVLGSFCRYAAAHGVPKMHVANRTATNGASKDLNSILVELREFIRSQNSIPKDDPEFTDDVDLQSAGYVDTFGFARLNTFIESKYGVNLAQAAPPRTLREIADRVTARAH